MTTYATIDIGTNTILLLVAEVENGRIKPLLEREAVARLGQGLKRTGFLAEDAMQRAITILARYLEECRTFSPKEVYAVGTSALREASNSDQFLEISRKQLGLSIEVISGEEEAYLSFLAVSKDLGENQKRVMVVDIGGGSTELILGKGQRVTRSMSLPMGAVRFTEEFLFSDPITEKEWMKLQAGVRKTLSDIPHPRDPFSLVAVGGTVTTLASVEQGLREFIPEKIHHFVLTKTSLERQLQLYRSKTNNDRKTIPGLPATRADVILAGGAILHQIMEELRCLSVLISVHGVRYGLLYKKLGL